ncbi:GntR family transcriptional regulator [Mucilaginibacter sp. 21P]|uniref:GntR family transcriptional regulator n=1 Tax=Mucilaginibacter sp. 21P TaxID=2778902 RepID=UPI001C58EAE2|nr:GntR family transcriptional regulator [Mucilaginibacter sp. 21P]QXV67076.1 GntR family transcriptional regulator [Mucilaginibacter sp. 21P]
MDFREKQAIYLQIAEYVCDQILLDKWPPGEKILSIRDLAVMMEVNPNTVQRAYDFLQQQYIITNKRGIGYFADEDAINKVIALRKQQFIETELPLFFRNMYLLKIPASEIAERYSQFIKQNFKE